MEIGLKKFDNNTNPSRLVSISLIGSIGKELYL